MSYKKTIQICKRNVQSLKSQIGLCEAQITYGTKRIKEKYIKQQYQLQQRLTEETFWYKKNVCIQWFLNHCDIDFSKNILDEKVNKMYEAMTPEDIRMCSTY